MLTLCQQLCGSASVASVAARLFNQAPSYPGPRLLPACRGRARPGVRAGRQSSAMADRLTQLQDAVNSVRRCCCPLLALLRFSFCRGEGPGAGRAALAAVGGVAAAGRGHRSRPCRGVGGRTGMDAAAVPRQTNGTVTARSSRTSSAMPSGCCSSAARRPPSATSRRQSTRTSRLIRRKASPPASAGAPRAGPAAECPVPLAVRHLVPGRQFRR